MQVRPYRLGDDEGVRQTIKAVYDEYGFIWDPDGYHSDLYELESQFQPPNRFWVAHTPENQIVGTVGIELFPAHPGEPGTLTVLEDSPRIAAATAELVRLYVHPQARKHGLGTKLTAEVLAYARTQNVHYLELWTDKVFTEAHRLYARFGATIIGDRHETEPEEFEEWGMLIDLDSPLIK